MAITTLITYLIVAYGICNIIIFANGPFHVFIKMHEWLKPRHPMIEEMLSCFICLPTWVGFGLSALNILFFPFSPFSPMNIILADKTLWPIIIFLDGMITSGGCWLIHTTQEAIERSNDSHE